MPAILIYTELKTYFSLAQGHSTVNLMVVEVTNDYTAHNDHIRCTPAQLSRVLLNMEVSFSQSSLEKY